MSLVLDSKYAHAYIFFVEEHLSWQRKLIRAETDQEAEQLARTFYRDVYGYTDSSPLKGLRNASDRVSRPLAGATVDDVSEGAGYDPADSIAMPANTPTTEIE